MGNEQVDLIKWLLVGAVAGYPFLGGFILYLVRELLKAKDTSVKIMQEATVYNRQTVNTLDKVNCVMEKVTELLR